MSELDDIRAEMYSSPKRDLNPDAPWIVDKTCKLCKGKTFNRLPVPAAWIGYFVYRFFIKGQNPF